MVGEKKKKNNGRRERMAVGEERLRVELRIDCDNEQIVYV